MFFVADQFVEDEQLIKNQAIACSAESSRMALPEPREVFKGAESVGKDSEQQLGFVLS